MGMTIPGVGASYAAAVQGINGGVPVAVSGPVNALIAQTLTSSTSLYLSGYCLGGLQTIANALRSSKLSGILKSIQVSIKSSQSCGFSVYLFNAQPTASTFTDHASPVIAAADAPKLIAGPITLPNAGGLLGANGSYSFLGDIEAVLQAASTTLYAVLVVTGLPTFLSSTDVQITYGIAQD
jgi:hypothetical protein